MRERILAFLAYCLIRLLSLTIRYRIEDESAIFRNATREPLLLPVWHNRVVLMPHLYNKYSGRKKLATLVSASRDGEIIAGVFTRYGFTPVRGSTSRRGRQALLELTRLVMEGYDASTTPDGPRGPRYEIQRGIIDLAAVTGCRILPASTILSHKIELKSWDRFQIPFPFVRCTIRIGQPISVPRDADDATRDAKRKELQEEMLRLSK